MRMASPGSRTRTHTVELHGIREEPHKIPEPLTGRAHTPGGGSRADKRAQGVSERR